MKSHDHYYDPKTIEPKWQEVWAKTKLYAARDFDERPKFTMLTEFPYPSGDGLHSGHAREYTIGDVLARYKRMQGYNVLYPMGYDAFGLPTENYAIKTGISPQEATAKNTATFRRQFDSLGYSMDWDRAVNTTDPSYYKWTQWLFLQFFKAGLAYQKEMPINWCPKEKTGLANEEVINGVHERCGTPVEKKLLKQWMLGITKYADRLIEGLKTVDYPSRIADQQVNWIGRSEGAQIDFAIDLPTPVTAASDPAGFAHRDTNHASLQASDLPGATTADANLTAYDGHKVTVYTTRPDTIFGATFLVVSPEVAQSWLEVGWQASTETKDYITKALQTSELARQEDTKEKTGVDTGVQAVNPATGEAIPVWVADYVLGSYGTGAIMAVPAHDERDYEFAQKFGIPIVPVIAEEHTENNFVDGQPLVERNVVQLIVKHPQDDAYLLLKRKDWEDSRYSYPVGGIEDNEDVIEAGLRELKEETGYTDIKSVKILPYVYYAEFYHEGKHVNRRARMNSLFVELNSLESVEVSPEEQAINEPEWLEPKSFEGKLFGSHVFDRYSNDRFCYLDAGTMINSGEFNGLPSAEAKQKITDYLVNKGVATPAVQYRLRDWIFSRQHYWGEPIPIIHCPDCGAVPVPDEQLPVVLPEVADYEPTGDGQSPLATVSEWVNVTCPKCGKAAKRETDTMPNWAGSSWYYLRYFDPHNDAAFADRKKLEYWGAVDMYLGGMEHTTLHLLYSRFWHQFFYDQGLVPTPEPYAARRGQGIVLAADGRKMSKSLGNVINPTDVIERVGADSLRLYILFMAPYDETTAWSDEHLSGVSRFLQRAWDVLHKPQTEEVDAAVDRVLHKTIQKVGEHLEQMRFNTAVSALMECVNVLTKQPAITGTVARQLTLMLAPFAPHLAEEVWHELRETESVHLAAWPGYDVDLVTDDVVEIAIQVNGKLRGTMAASADATDDELSSAAQAVESVAKHLADQKIVKTIVVPGKLVNFVVA